MGIFDRNNSGQVVTPVGPPVATGGGGGSVTSVSTGIGLSGGPITAAGTVSFDTDYISASARTLTTALGPKLDWANSILYDSSTIDSVNWQSRRLIDNASVISIDWLNRQLKNTSGVSVLKWSALTAGTSGYVLSTDGAGNVSWIVSPGANTALSNLSSVAINTTLLPASADTIDVGSSTFAWRSLYVKNPRIINSTGTEVGQITPTGTTPSGVSSVLSFFSEGTTQSIGLWTSSGTSSANSYWESGNASGGGSGNLYVKSGTATTTRGSLYIDVNEIETKSRIFPNTDNTTTLGQASFNWQIVHARNFLGDGATGFGSNYNSGATANFQTGHSSGAANCAVATFQAGDQLGTGTGTVSSVVVAGGSILNASNANNAGNLLLKGGTTAGAGLAGGVIASGRFFRPPVSASAPTSPTAGDMYYDTTTNKSYTWDGTTWQAHW